MQVCNNCQSKQFDGTILCVSHDRFFLEQIVGRLLVLKPPVVVSFDGTYHDWVAKEAAKSRAPVEAKKSEAKRVVTKPSPAPRQTKKDNPYARPFGRLTLKELEREITDTEVAIADHQMKFGDAGAMKDQSRARRMQDEYQSLSKKLEQLEAEYFEREK